MGGSARAPARVQAVDAKGNYVSLVYFGGNSGWVKKLLPLDEPRWVSGKLETMAGIADGPPPTMSCRPARRASIRGARPSIPVRKGSPRSASPRWPSRRWRARPSCPNGSSRASRRGTAGPAGARRWRGSTPIPPMPRARERLAYDEVFATQLALMLVRGEARAKRGRPLHGDGRLRDRLRLPYAPTGAQARTIAEIEGDLAQSRPMLRLLQGDVGSGKTLVAACALLIAGRGRRAGGIPRAHRDIGAPALRDADPASFRASTSRSRCSPGATRARSARRR